MNPLAVLQKRYPDADFSIYFRYLNACVVAVRSDLTNEHHICPRKQFPEYADGFPENRITLLIDDHVFAHKLLGAAVPALRVNVNEHGYCGLTFEQRQAAGRKGAAITGARGIRTQIEQGLGVHAPGYDRSAIVSSGGRACALLKVGAHANGAARRGGQVTRDLKHGVFSMTKEQQRAAASNGAAAANHKRWHIARGITSVTCQFCK